ncbi:hypothetical protein ACGF8B_38260 [Streptomyces sp. NPDC047917]|uniref:hypothetical protein n=1 Tax=Streptomyces sp. NPDC047917 TaxID=3365491 RepID=UPI003714D8F7
MRPRALAEEHPADPVAAGAIDAAVRIHNRLRRLEAERLDSRTDPLFETGRFAIGLNVVDGGVHGSRNLALVPDRTTLEYAIFYPPATGVSENTVGDRARGAGHRAACPLAACQPSAHRLADALSGRAYRPGSPALPNSVHRSRASGPRHLVRRSGRGTAPW